MKLSVVRKSLRSNGARCRSLSGVGVHMYETSKGKEKEKKKRWRCPKKDIKLCEENGGSKEKERKHKRKREEKGMNKEG